MPQGENTVKKPIRSLATLLALALLLLSLAGCTTIEDAEAETLVFACLDAIGRGDYAAADDCFHPAARRDIAFLSCEEYADQLMSRHRLDLSVGYTVVDVQTYASAGIADAYYEYSFEGTVGGTRVAVTAVLYRDEEGFGLYELAVAPLRQSSI